MHAQLASGIEGALEEDSDYLTRQLITYIGSKRALLGHIGKAVAIVKRRLGKRRLRVLDAFSGSGVVSRYLKAHSECLASNDIEDYAAVVGRCFLTNRSAVDMELLQDIVHGLNARVGNTGLPTGFIEDLYAPRDEDRIGPQDRAFYTRENARRLDNYRRLIGGLDAKLQDLMLGPLLSEASVHANTAGVFKGFYKDRRTGVGRFGGTNSDALSRIRGPVVLGPPVLSRFECDVEVFQQDANALAPRLRDLDLAYLDPPYNQHPYGSNYFMLNLIVTYTRPECISAVSGIPADWRRSAYNSRGRCLHSLKQLVQALDAKFVLLSSNDEGFIPPPQMRLMLEEAGDVEVMRVPYNTFRGSRNLRGRAIHVTEHLYLVERR